jgi:putative tricarboxylic transport membrane protein
VKKYERATAVMLAVGGIWIMLYAWRTLKLGSIHTPDAGFLPFLCGAGLVILSFIWLVILLWTKERMNGEAAEKRLWHRPVAALALMVLYGWAMEALGYITSTLVFMIAWEQIIERETWLKTILISLLGTVSMYALFVYLLKVPVPPEFLIG